MVLMSLHAGLEEPFNLQMQKQDDHGIVVHLAQVRLSDVCLAIPK